VLETSLGEVLSFVDESEVAVLRGNCNSNNKVNSIRLRQYNTSYTGTLHHRRTRTDRQAVG